jgi:hypothetical protein
MSSPPCLLFHLQQALFHVLRIRIQIRPRIQIQLQSPSTPSTQGSNPISVSHRVRTHGVLLRSDSEPERKRVKTTSETNKAIELIVSVLKDQQGRGRVRFNTVELAIQLLQKEYETRLSGVHFLVVIDLLTAEAKASVFITLNSNIRDPL